MTQDPLIDAAPDRPRRNARAWIVLLIAWAIGLLIWTVYIAAFVYLVIRILT